MGHRLMIEFVGQGIRMSLDEAHDMLGGLRCQKDVDSRAVRCNAGKLQLRGESPFGVLADGLERCRRQVRGIA
jgi:hypothetical protein